MNRALSPRRSAASLAAWFLPVCAFVALGAVAVVAAPPTAAPTISHFSPAQGPVGSTVLIVGTNFRPPLVVTFAGNVVTSATFTPGEVTVTVPPGAQTGPIKITESGGTVSTATNFTVGEALPVVTLAATVPKVTAGSGVEGLFTLTLSSPQTSDLVVNYFVAGTAINGTDYARLKGTAKIKAGKTTKPIKIIPTGDLGGAAKKVVKVTLAEGSGYTPGTTTLQKVKIFAGQ